MLRKGNFSEDSVFLSESRNSFRNSSNDTPVSPTESVGSVFIRVGRNETKKAKTHLELNLSKDVKDNKKGVLEYINNKRKTKDNTSLLLNEGSLVTEDAEKAELLCTFFAFVFTGKTSPQGSLTDGTWVKECWKEDFPLVKED
ncbi:rna-directed dna polymerase from mobile element jockey-like [Pitangus sulphuratus]|nr:rna-directed dna polymerase from mobile element jockey-like [Pitangus sulphuratus]